MADCKKSPIYIEIEHLIASIIAQRKQRQAARLLRAGTELRLLKKL